MKPTHIVLGGGTSGCVVASRLSEDERNGVLLIEAGRDYAPAATPPDILSSYAGYAWVNREYYWQDLQFRRREGSPAEHLEQARVIGGGSSINGQVSLRGAPIRDRTRVLRLVIADGRVSGAVIERNAHTETVQADTFVLCAGALRTPMSSCCPASVRRSICASTGSTCCWTAPA